MKPETETDLACTVITLHIIINGIAITLTTHITDSLIQALQTGWHSL